MDLECPNCGYVSSAIEAEIDRLRSALQEIIRMDDQNSDFSYSFVADVARRALNKS